MDNTISRQWLMECVNEGWIKFDTEKDTNTYIHLVRDIAPSAQQWIPVVDGLPGKYEYVLLTCERNGNLVTDFGCLSPDIDGDPSWWIAVHDLTEGWRVIAWMPLPSPWKGERHD